MPKGRYRLERVNVELKTDRTARWKIREEPVVRGTEYVYEVVDSNYTQRNQWEFLVRVPKKKGVSIEVRPSLVPDVQVWGGLDRRAMMFEQVRRGRNSGDCYCKLALADPAGERTRLIARVDEKKKLPYWLKTLNGRMRSKESVRHTRGTDSDSLVIVVDPADHQRMVALFLAAKAWVLKERFQLRG
jgi:hypothetical protein